MSLRAADFRFLLATPPRTATIAAALPEISTAFVAAGVELVSRDADVAIAPAAQARAALAGGPESVIALGRGAARPLAGHRPVVRRFITLPSSHAPHVVLPVDRPAAAAYALDTWATTTSWLRRIRGLAAKAAIAGGVFPDVGRTITLGVHDTRAPFIVNAAAPFGLPVEGDWFLTLGIGDDLTRAVFHLFAPGEPHPAWIIKFARVPGYDSPFKRDERALVLAASSSVASAHAPRFLGRFDVASLHGSVETAAVGPRLTYLLQAAGPRAQKLDVVESVAAWLVELSRATALAPAKLAEERRRLQRDVLPSFRSVVPVDLVDRIEEVPGVLQHNDLGCWNLIVRPGGFTAVDWESAARCGLPLWDLLYFLVDALMHLDGAESPERREAYAARLLNGEQPGSSDVLFRWVGRACRALAIPAISVGPIVTLAWLHHGLSPVARATLSAQLAPDSRGEQTFSEWMLRVWLQTPGLGADWKAYRDSPTAGTSIPDH